MERHGIRVTSMSKSKKNNSDFKFFSHFDREFEPNKPNSWTTQTLYIENYPFHYLSGDVQGFIHFCFIDDLNQTEVVLNSQKVHDGVITGLNYLIDINTSRNNGNDMKDTSCYKNR